VLNVSRSYLKEMHHKGRVKRRFVLVFPEAYENFKYGFSLICSTVSRSVQFNFSWMSIAPRAIRTGLAFWPRFLWRSLA